jgi:hypothetical protein
MKILNIVETAYRATLEEQDDTVLWLSRALQGAGADLALLLRANAVNYLVRQECPALAVGRVSINHPARPNEDLLRLRQQGARVFAITEDVEERGIERGQCISGVEMIHQRDLAGLLEEYDQIWHW